MVNFYIYYNIYTHTYIHIYIYLFINIKNSGKPETVHRYWSVSEIYRTTGQTGTASDMVLTPLLSTSKPTPKNILIQTDLIYSYIDSSNMHLDSLRIINLMSQRPLVWYWYGIQRISVMFKVIYWHPLETKNNKLFKL